MKSESSLSPHLRSGFTVNAEKSEVETPKLDEGYNPLELCNEKSMFLAILLLLQKELKKTQSFVTKIASSEI